MNDGQRAANGIAYERRGPRGGTPVVLVHAGIADRRMWDPLWPDLTTQHDGVRIDLRGFGESSEPPVGPLFLAGDVAGVLDELGIGRAHLVGASLGAGVVVELALDRPAAVSSLVLAAPGGVLIGDRTRDLDAFIAAEGAALAAGDVDAAVEANLAWWVDGPSRTRDRIDPDLRRNVAIMQRQAFDIVAGWAEVDEAELDPPALARLAEVAAPTLILLGTLDLDAIREAARTAFDQIPEARLVEWPDVAHLPSMERPRDFRDLLLDWLSERAPR